MTASAVLFICLLLKVLLPYARYFLTIAYRYERTHHVSDKIISMCANTVESVSKKTIQIANSTLKNELFVGSVAYCVDGICGGFTEALEKGVGLLETPRD